MKKKMLRRVRALPQAGLVNAAGRLGSCHKKVRSMSKEGRANVNGRTG